MNKNSNSDEYFEKKSKKCLFPALILVALNIVLSIVVIYFLQKLVTNIYLLMFLTILVCIVISIIIANIIDKNEMVYQNDYEQLDDLTDILISIGTLSVTLITFFRNGINLEGNSLMFETIVSISMIKISTKLLKYKKYIKK